MLKIFKVNFGNTIHQNGKASTVAQGTTAPIISHQSASLAQAEPIDVLLNGEDARVTSEALQQPLSAPQKCSSFAQTLQVQLPINKAELSDWLKLIVEACVAPNSEFNKASQAIFPGWNQQMRVAFLTQDDPRRWSMLPNARTLAETFLAETHGPLSKLEPANMFAGLGTVAQYSVGVPKGREQALSLMRHTFGSNLYFHGSDVDKWHQITAQGLEPKSGSVMMSGGSAHGDGVYVATDTFLSKRFVGKDTNFVALGLVEVIHHPRVKPFYEALVVPEKLYLQLKFLLIYPNVSAIPEVNFLQLRYSTMKIK